MKVLKKVTFLSLSFISLVFLWFIGFQKGIVTAINVWSVSEIYNHCFLVLPCSVYFIYQKRSDFSNCQIRPNWILLFPLIFLLFLQTFAQIGDIKILMHIATFIALPIIFWLAFGNEISKVVAFPLFFIIFSIPIGDQLVPYLQELTTDLAVPLLELTNVPVYRNGLYLDIPEGRFLVAEACSGISFLITSVVFGFIYSYVSFSSYKKRALFILLSLLIPIAANALRVYGIILTGHLTNMEHAVGADHLIYGGVFFGIVLMILIGVGECIRDESDKIKIKVEQSKTRIIRQSTLSVLSPLIVLSVLIVIQQFWQDKVSKIFVSHYSLSKDFKNIELIPSTNVDWQPNLYEPEQIYAGDLSIKNTKVKVYLATFDEVTGELISSRHRLYSDKRWTQESSKKMKDLPLTNLKLISQIGTNKQLFYGYLIDGQIIANATKVKLLQTFLKLQGKDYRGVLVSFAYDGEQQSIELISSILQKIVKSRK